MVAAAYPRFAPDFQIQINGQGVPAALRASVTSVRFESGLRAADRVEVEIANPNVRWLQSHIRGLGSFNAPTGVSVNAFGKKDVGHVGLFDLDSKLTLSLGYAPRALQEVFQGEITGVEANFPASGMPTMTVVAHNYLHRLGNGRYARGFGLLPDWVIAAILSAENVLLPAIDPTIVAVSSAMTVLNALFLGTGRKQKGQSALELLKEIADKYDADFWVAGDVLYLSRFIKSYSPDVSLTWGESLLEFSPKMTSVGQVAGVSLKFTLQVIPLDFLVTVFWDFDQERLGVSVVPGAAGTVAAVTATALGPVITLITQPIASPLDITNSALRLVRALRNKINNRLTGVGSAIGDPRIRPGAMIHLDGLGADFSDDYRVVSASHVIDAGGYRTSFKVRKEVIP